MPELTRRGFVIGAAGALGLLSAGGMAAWGRSGSPVLPSSAAAHRGLNR